MIIKKLSIAGLRGFIQAEFDFLPGMNLLVGVNGVGKTTALDALRICASKILPELTSTTSPKQSFTIGDINVSRPLLQVSCTFEHEENQFQLVTSKQRKARIIKVEQKLKGKKITKDKYIETEDVEQILPELNKFFSTSKKSSVQPLVLYFSTRRSLFVNQKISDTKASGGQAAAFAESLSNAREVNLVDIAHWLRAQDSLAKELSKRKGYKNVIADALSRFLPGMSNLKVKKEDGTEVVYITKGKKELNVSMHLSDGERGVLGIVLEIAKRLSQANPGLKNPIKEGCAIILIDELDLHLHPKWQRTIVENLTITFPSCQFIATTHSPQIIPSLEPERIQLISYSDILRPDRSLGMDSNWILNHLMEANDRPDAAAIAIEKVEKAISQGKFEMARKTIATYKKEGFDLPEWSVFEARIARLEIFESKK